MSLFKIPIIALVTYSYNAAIRLPNPIPPQNELKKTIGIDNVNHIWWRANGTIACQYLAAISEIVTIFAINFPSWPGSRLALSMFVFRSGQPQDLCLNLVSFIGFGLMATGAIIRLACYRALGRFFRFALSIQDKHKLITTGPYSVVRHPGYTGLVCIVTGWFLWNGAEGSWLRQSGILNTLPGLAFVAVYSIVGIFAVLVVTVGKISIEDECLWQQFGKQWEDWLKNVPYSLFPGLY